MSTLMQKQLAEAFPYAKTGIGLELIFEFSNTKISWPLQGWMLEDQYVVERVVKELREALERHSGMGMPDFSDKTET